jgi:hypothetical protein
MERRKRRHRDAKDYVLREDIDDPNILKDGERMRVPMTMADSINLDDHQPGPHRTNDRALLDAKEAAYRQREFEDSIAWMPAHMRPRYDAVPPSTRDQADAQPIFDERFVKNDRAETTRAYAEYDQRMANAWRGSCSRGNG